jgi:hypothetical protein
MAGPMRMADGVAVGRSKTAEEIFAESLAAAASAGSQSTSKADQEAAMRLYYGKRYNGSGMQKSFVSVNEAINDFYSFSDTDRINLGRTMYQYGLISDANDYTSILRTWQQAVGEAARFYNSRSRREVSPYDALAIMAGLRTDGRNSKGGYGNPRGGGSAAPARPTTRTTRSKSYNIPSATEAKALITNIFRDQVGRGPSDAEVARYTSMFVGAAKRNPTVTTQTARFDSTGALTSQKSTSSGGVNLETVGTDEVQDDPEYGAYQAATQYMNALLRAIGGT